MSKTVATYCFLILLLMNCSSDDSSPANNNNSPEFVKTYGGSKNDSAQSVTATTDGGYIVLGHTQSNDNDITDKQDESFDYWILKFDANDQLQWQKTYGGFYNEYGYTAEKAKTGFIIKGTKQNCPNNTDINRKCTTNVWFVTIDKNGKEVSNQLLEEIKL